MSQRVLSAVHPFTVMLALAVGLAGSATTAGASDARAAPPLVDVIVTMRAQAPSAGLHGPQLERVLRRTAAREQRGLLALLARRTRSGAVRRVDPFWIFDGVRVVATRAVLREVARLPAVASVRANVRVRAAISQAPATTPAPAAPASANVALVGAPALWARGVTGGGVVVASLDSGVDASHPDLAGSFRGGAGSWFDATGEHPSAPIDTSGHGTATMGVIVGGGASGATLGVAPGARWIAARIFDDRGRAQTSWIHAAFQWLLDPDGNPSTDDAPQVVNASWTLESSRGCNLEFEPDLRRLREARIVPVFASGNRAADASPANNPSALAVGGIGLDGTIDPASGRGRSSCGQAIYPQLVAPDADVPTTDLFGLYATQTGTSLAAPHVSGALALLLSRFPGTSAPRQQTALEQSAADLGPAGADATFGYGRLDVAAAADWLARAADFTVRPERWEITTRAGRSADVRLTVRSLRGFRGRVALSVAGLPAGARATSTSARVRTGQVLARLRISTPASLRPGSYPVTITGASGARRRPVTIGLVVRGSD